LVALFPPDENNLHLICGDPVEHAQLAYPQFEIRKLRRLAQAKSIASCNRGVILRETRFYRGTKT
jgi:hypothetical protein